MACEEVQPFVQGEADIAVLAFRHPATVGTFYHWRKATAVLEQNGLVPALESRADGRQQPWGERAAHHLTVAEVLDIDDLHGGKLYALVSLVEAHIAVFAGLGVVVCLHRRRGGAQEGLGTVHLCQDYCR